jgi:hypothetical protein
MTPRAALHFVLPHPDSGSEAKISESVGSVSTAALLEVPMTDPVKINLNPNWKEDAIAVAKEKIESILRLRCAEHDKTPLLENVEGKLTIETCCDAFEKQVKEALAR